MLLIDLELRKSQDSRLAPYAQKNSDSKGRQYGEKTDPLRLPFQRDRDRIIHAKAFRRLQGKTQVFHASHGDHFRSRLTHTLEVSQIARDIARNLRLNEDLAEAIALAHDLGHTPFGHAGEEALNEVMQEYGEGFEHNKQSRRVVEIIEQKYLDFPGLNLTFEVLDGLIKHRTSYDKGELGKSSLEAQVVNIADSIAYNAHDIDDGIRGNIITLDQCRELKIWKRIEEELTTISKNEILERQVIRNLINTMVNDVLKKSDNNFQEKKYEVQFSRGLQSEISELQEFLSKKFYLSKKVLEKSRHGQEIIKELFEKLIKNEQTLSKEFDNRLKSEPKHIVVQDYIAGMTDKFALNLAQKL